MPQHSVWWTVDPAALKEKQVINLGVVCISVIPHSLLAHDVTHRLEVDTEQQSPSTDPCGTPVPRSVGEEHESPMSTDWL